MLGCIVWVPCFYAFSTLYLVENNGVSNINSINLFLFGLFGIILNYWADYQKKNFRENINTSRILGRKPAYIKVFFYIDEKLYFNYLLTSGFWGITRHFNYIPELIAAYSWCLCC